MQIASLQDLKAHLSEYADRAEREHERFTITRNGRPSFVVMSAEDLESLEETLFWLSRPGTREDLAEARAAEDAGDAGAGMDEAELRASLGLASGAE
jgi:prevent-host-death family protein